MREHQDDRESRHAAERREQRRPEKSENVARGSRTTVALEPGSVRVETWIDVETTRGRLFEFQLGVPPGLAIETDRARWVRRHVAVVSGEEDQEVATTAVPLEPPPERIEPGRLARAVESLGGDQQSTRPGRCHAPMLAARHCRVHAGDRRYR